MIQGITCTKQHQRWEQIWCKVEWVGSLMVELFGGCGRSMEINGIPRRQTCLDYLCINQVIYHCIMLVKAFGWQRFMSAMLHFWSQRKKLYMYRGHLGFAGLRINSKQIWVEEAQHISKNELSRHCLIPTLPCYNK